MIRVRPHAGRRALKPQRGIRSLGARRRREEIPGAIYESGKSQVSVRVPRDGVARFPAVVRAADALLAVTREAA